MENGELLYSLQEGVASVTINRPEKLNALDSALVDSLYTLFCKIDLSQEVRVVVLKGAGGKAFVAGADIGELAQMTDSFQFRQYFNSNERLFDKMASLSQPIIAAVDGYAFGGGCSLTLASDLVVATAKSKFGVQEINMGFVGNGSPLTRLVGRHKAAELTMFGGTINAQEAYRLNLVNHVAEDVQEFDQVLSDMCRKLAAKSPYALKMTKQTIRRALDIGLTQANDYETDAASLCFGTSECRDAIDAFIKKA